MSTNHASETSAYRADRRKKDRIEAVLASVMAFILVASIIPAFSSGGAAVSAFIAGGPIPPGIGYMFFGLLLVPCIAAAYAAYLVFASIRGNGPFFRSRATAD